MKLSFAWALHHHLPLLLLLLLLFVRLLNPSDFVAFGFSSSVTTTTILQRAHRTFFNGATRRRRTSTPVFITTQSSMGHAKSVTQGMWMALAPDSIETTSTASDSIPPVATGNTRTLAGDYLIECTAAAAGEGFDRDDKTLTWSLLPLTSVVNHLDPAFSQSEGATAWAAVMQQQSSTSFDSDAQVVLQSRIISNKDDGRIHITVNHNNDGSSSSTSSSSTGDLVAVLARVLVQWTLALEAEEAKSTTFAERIIHWPNDGTTALPVMNESDSSQQHQERIQKLLYEGIFDITESEEVVEMVDHQGHVLGRVPRKLVHKYNLLHRGIGMFVTRDKPIIVQRTTPPSTSGDQKQQQQPDLYCHQRTATKRIFPSLYDMFVGGVALAGESSELTARREVAEELGLTQALDNAKNHRLSERLFTCAVCTAYNRCVVDFFTYTMDTSTETTSWQEEEVAWGDFVPYVIVQAAADLSIQRLAERKEWPGRYPPIQSGVDPLKTSEFFKDDEWKTWDFVPDGLLVWEAWLQYLDEKAE